MMKTIDLICTTCGDDFKKRKNEYDRQIKNNRTEFFCTRTCAAIKNNEDKPRKGNLNNLNSHNRLDEYTPFKYFVNRSKYREEKKEKITCNITVKYLKEIWEKQNGICPFTGWKLILPKNPTYPWFKSDPMNASLDRIDNSLGYIEGNVRFISYMANLGRQSFTDDELINFCKSVANNFKDK